MSFDQVIRKYAWHWPENDWQRSAMRDLGIRRRRIHSEMNLLLEQLLVIDKAETSLRDIHPDELLAPDDQTDITADEPHAEMEASFTIRLESYDCERHEYTATRLDIGCSIAFDPFIGDAFNWSLEEIDEAIRAPEMVGKRLILKHDVCFGNENACLPCPEDILSIDEGGE